jgi:hypothetical protein
MQSTNLIRYIKILDYAGFSIEGADKLWTFIAGATPEQKAMIISKAKKLLKTEAICKELSQFENAVLYLLTAIDVYLNRPKSSDEYLALDDEIKQEFAHFDNAVINKYAKLDKRRVYLKDIPTKEKKVHATQLQAAVQANYYMVYSLYTYGHTWKTITKKVNETFGLNVSTAGLYNAFKKVSNSIGAPLPEKGRRMAKGSIDADAYRAKNNYSKEFVNSFLNSKCAYIVEKRKKGVSYRMLAAELSKMIGLRIGHHAVYMFCIKKGI